MKQGIDFPIISNLADIEDLAERFNARSELPDVDENIIEFVKALHPHVTNIEFDAQIRITRKKLHTQPR
jgi:hypothetical protein